MCDFVALAIVDYFAANDFVDRIDCCVVDAGYCAKRKLNCWNCSTLVVSVVQNEIGRCCSLSFGPLFGFEGLFARQ